MNMYDVRTYQNRIIGAILMNSLKYHYFIEDRNDIPNLPNSSDLVRATEGKSQFRPYLE